MIHTCLSICPCSNRKSFLFALNQKFDLSVSLRSPRAQTYDLGQIKQLILLELVQILPNRFVLSQGATMKKQQIFMKKLRA